MRPRLLLPLTASLAVLAASCGTSKTASAPQPQAVSASPVVPNAVARPLAVGGTALVAEVDPNDGSRQTNDVTLDAVRLMNHTDAENVTKPYLIVTVTVVCKAGPCSLGDGSFTVHEADGTRVDDLAGILDTGQLDPGTVLQTGEKIKASMAFDGPKTGVLVYAPHDATLASWNVT